MDLALATFTHDGRPGLRLTGRLNGHTAAGLEQQLAMAGTAPDWWDLGGLEFLSSAGLRVLLAHEKRRRRLGAPQSTLVGMQPAIRELLELTGLTAFWQVLPALPAAGLIAEDAGSLTVPVAPVATVAMAQAVWSPLEGVPGALVVWETAAGQGASLATLPLAFGRAGLGVTREAAARHPFGFATLGTTLALRHDDGEDDALTVANPATRFLRLQQAWLLAGAPAGRLQLTAAGDWQAWPDRLPSGLATPWLGSLVVLPATAGGSQVALAVTGPADETGARATVGVTLDLPALDFAALTDCLAVDAAIEMMAAAAAAGPRVGVPGRLPAGTLLWVWTATAATPARDHVLEVTADGADDATELLVRTLYADCRRASLVRLSGGFSAATWLVQSEDASGRRHLPTVLKVGPPAMMNRENAAHEAHVRPFILNNASVALGHATQGESVGLRYNFVGITGDTGDLKTLARRWQEGGEAEVIRLFGQLARETLRPWYGQARRRPARLYADHSPLRLFTDLPAAAAALLKDDYAAPRLPCPALGRDLPNPWRFLTERWARLGDHTVDCALAITHGDLNLNNLLVDGRGNLYVIDFSETRERSVASDFARNEPVFLLERAVLGSAAAEAAFLRDVARLYDGTTAWHEVPRQLATVDASRLAFLRETRRLASEYLGADAPLQAWLLPLLEWTLPITLFGNLPEPNRRLATWVAALQLERLQLVAQEAAQDLS